MQLQEIKEETCSVCGSRAYRERQEHRHCNGHWNEYRTFECGRSLHFSPNFMKVLVDSECPKHPETVAEKDRHKQASDKLRNYVSRLDATDKFKSNILERLDYVLVK